MQRHPFFTGIGFVERATIHQWPLSCVQRLLLEDGTKLIYRTTSRL